MAYVNVYAKLGETCGRIRRKAVNAQYKLSDEAFRCCTKFCKKDTGKLMASGRVERGSGTMTWDAEYARYAYYTGTPDRSKNPYASLMWAHKAARLYFVRWKRLVERELL